MWLCYTVEKSPVLTTYLTFSKRFKRRLSGTHNEEPREIWSTSVDTTWNILGRRGRLRISWIKNLRNWFSLSMQRSFRTTESKVQLALLISNIQHMQGHSEEEIIIKNLMQEFGYIKLQQLSRLGLKGGLELYRNVVPVHVTLRLS